MKRHPLLRPLLLAAILATAVMIFLFSSQDGSKSQETSAQVTEAVLEIVEPSYDLLPPDRQQSLLSSAEQYIRKLAHFSEFALLALLLTAYLVLSRRDGRLRPAFFVAWGIAAAYACTDEVHQMFVSDRGPSPADVGIDALGALTGALLMCAVIALTRRFRASGNRA